MKFKKGDKAVMVNCGEGEHYAGKIWTCRGDSFKDNNKEEVVFLEGFSGYFHCRFLVKPYKDEGSVVILPNKGAVNVELTQYDLHTIITALEFRASVWESDICGADDAHENGRDKNLMKRLAEFKIEEA